jgi:hypothetical protein
VKLTTLLSKLEKQIKIEKAINRAHLVTINGLEKKLIFLGHYLCDKSRIEYLMKDKDKKI